MVPTGVEVLQQGRQRRNTQQRKGGKNIDEDNARYAAKRTKRRRLKAMVESGRKVRKCGNRTERAENNRNGSAAATRKRNALDTSAGRQMKKDGYGDNRCECEEVRRRDCG